MAVKVGSIADVPAGTVVGFDVSGTKVAATSIDGAFVAFEDRCPHMGCSLSAMGTLDGRTLTCGCHGSEFDVTSGEVLGGPARSPLLMRSVIVEGGDLLISD